MTAFTIASVCIALGRITIPETVDSTRSETRPLNIFVGWMLGANGASELIIYTCLFRHFWQSIKKRKNTIKYSGFVPYIHI